MKNIDEVPVHQLACDVRTATDPDVLAIAFFQPCGQGARILGCKCDAVGRRQFSVREDVAVEGIIDPAHGGQLRHDLMVGPPAHDDRVDTFDEFWEAVGTLHPSILAGEPVDLAIPVGDEAVTPLSGCPPPGG